MSSPGRNEPCPCGSGIKYKKCCLNNESSRGFSSRPFYSLDERTKILYYEMVSAFGINKCKEWKDIKKFITGERISYFHKVIASLWPPDTNLASLLPKPGDGKLRALFMGRHRPDLVLQNIVRYALYTDEILVLFPFQNPWCIRSEFNPIENPDQYKSYMLHNIDFVQRLAPWIFSGHVKLIPDPGDFDHQLRSKTFEMINASSGANKKIMENYREEDPEDYDYMVDRVKPFILGAPEEYLRTSIKKWNPNLTQEQTDKLLVNMRETVQNDPYTVYEPNDSHREQLIVSKCGTSVEMGLYISNLTGAYMYTDWKPKWDLISSIKDKNENTNVWTPLTKAFQNLDFRFLNNVTPQFACSLRGDGRLEIFRSFLRKTWVDINKEQTSLSSSIGNNYADELKSEYVKAQAEWDDIDKNLIQKMALGTGVTAIGGALASGGMNWEIPAGGFIISGITNLLTSKYDRNRFRASCPMSVFIDLRNKKK